MKNNIPKNNNTFCNSISKILSSNVPVAYFENIAVFMQQVRLKSNDELSICITFFNRPYKLKTGNDLQLRNKSVVSSRKHTRIAQP